MAVWHKQDESSKGKRETPYWAFPILRTEMAAGQVSLPDLICPQASSLLNGSPQYWLGLREEHKCWFVPGLCQGNPPVENVKALDKLVLATFQGAFCHSAYIKTKRISSIRCTFRGVHPRTEAPTWEMADKAATTTRRSADSQSSKSSAISLRCCCPPAPVDMDMILLAGARYMALLWWFPWKNAQSE